LGRKRLRKATPPGIWQTEAPATLAAKSGQQTVRKVRGLIVVIGDSIVQMGKTRDAQIQKRFGERMRDLRRRKELSQESLALACGMDRSYIGGVERGERNISLVNIGKIAGALGIAPRELL